jgi:tRNA (cmo5U34)-methyltransferase
MRPGGCLILSEKLAFDDPEEQQLLHTLHHGFKQLQGYSALEVAQKRAAIENVLIPESLETHRRRLLAAGFRRVTVWLQCLNFLSLLAQK